jgi:hypothetical protein
MKERPQDATCPLHISPILLEIVDKLAAGKFPLASGLVPVRQTPKLISTHTRIDL